IFTIFNKILLFVFFSFTFLTIITGHSVWDTLDPTRVGLRLFFNSYIAFGIFSVVGFIINFILIKLRGFDYKYLIGLIFYAVLTYLSNSRNAQLICLIILVLSYIKPIYSVLLKFRYPLIFTILVLLAYNFYSIKSYLTSDLVVFFTSGRSNIWNYLFEDLIKHNFLFGKGIFGRNHLILENNIDHNYYLQRVDFLYFHNSYLEILSAAGLIGLVFFMFFVKENIDKGLKFMRPIVLSIFIGSFFEGFLIQPMLLISMLFWMIIFINAVVKKMPINDLRANS
ncbi:MAG TPA: O-antigen ligase family protein, partial [Defluviitaleaceae bacterium]|nr:O-antigen ligase family protein [Defluviitaleaceae bacterium]